ncbi:MAG: rRNA pseudouridine synthase [Phycisphaeraceae bacterium]|nr:rRNA pseudouridine synthase [Phycisphaeraceae bacterium]
MADAGIASRRDCERMIEDGLVEVNGRIVTELPVWVDPAEDTIVVEGRKLKKPSKNVYVMFNKPARTVTTTRDEEGALRRIVTDFVNHPLAPRLFPVGRLDFESVGLLLLTNDGDLAHALTHPRYGLPKTYLVHVRGSLDDDQIEKLRDGLYLADRKSGKTVGASRTAEVKVELVKRNRDTTVLEMTLHEGRNRQIRRMLAHVDHPVKKLERIAIGPLKMKGVQRGHWRELTPPELHGLQKAVKRASKAAAAKTD